MVGRRRSAFGTVVGYEVPRQRLRKLQDRADLPGDTLGRVLTAYDRQVRFDDRKRVAIDRELSVELYALFLGWKILSAQKARAFRNRCRVDGCRRTAGAMRNMPDKHLIPIDPDGDRPSGRQALKTARERRPGTRLACKEIFYLPEHLRIRA